MQMKRSPLFNDNGNALIISVIIVALLVASGMAYMKWASDERWDTAYEEATIKAYFLAQTGIIEKGMLYLRTRKPNELPTGTIHLGNGIVADFGSYYQTKVMRVQSMGDGNLFQRSDTYDVYSTGRAEFVNHQLGNSGYGNNVTVERTAKMRAKLRSFSNYMYLTNYEVTGPPPAGPYNDVIWFWTYDSLYGRVHSNDFIGIKYNPHFYGPVSSVQENFREYDANPYFEYPPQFNVAPVLFPRTAKTLRANASWINDGNGRYMTRVWLKGGEGIVTYQYELGGFEPPLNIENLQDDELVFNIRTFNPPAWGAIFINGQAEVYGELSGNLSIGTAGDMWLVDNIWYSGSDERNGRWSADIKDTNMPNMLGLVSEKNIWIKNNWVNGRENGYRQYGAAQIDHHSITITAGLVALDQSFSFQHQNDTWDAYQGPDPWDERGIIHLKGAVTQWRRGYVHRSNHQGTGYGKDYEYDFRFDIRPPPFYLEAMDEDGHGLFDIISWGELEPSK